ncbi:hypothetical protein T459_21336 [Capsicum annuum]|uniref:Uncharacterized protein n=1 Tax=Capsicum annuum TaxID=4072 RepID=A0A2G2YWE3_CAPAN|nr:hypothetical protein T459_21336 [Capsicum annuum]
MEGRFINDFNKLESYAQELRDTNFGSDVVVNISKDALEQDEVIKVNEELREGLWGDLGIGSSALAIGIARSLGSKGRVIATDLSLVSTIVASYNV